MKQEVRIKLDVTIELDAKYSTDEIKRIVHRNVGYKNNHKTINNLMFMEEEAIYDFKNGTVRTEKSDWTKIFPIADG